MRFIGSSFDEAPRKYQDSFADGDGKQSLDRCPLATHFSVSPTTCRGRAADAVAAFAGIRRISASRNHSRIPVRPLAENFEHCLLGLRNMREQRFLSAAAQNTKRPAAPLCSALLYDLPLRLCVNAGACQRSEERKLSYDRFRSGC